MNRGGCIKEVNCSKNKNILSIQYSLDIYMDIYFQFPSDVEINHINSISKCSCLKIKTEDNFPSQRRLINHTWGSQLMLQVNGTTSTTYHMPGGGHQGTLLRALKYFVQWNDNANWVGSQSGLRFINVDDLTIFWTFISFFP